MDYLFLLAAMIASATLSVMSFLFGKHNATVDNKSSLNSVIVTFSAMIVWGGVALLDGDFHPRVLVYSLIYGVCYTTAMFGMFKAYQTDSVSMTAFVKQLSLIAVSFWGFIFWETPFTSNIAIGLLLIVLALYLCFMPDKRSTRKINLKWFFFSLMLLVGNAGCSITQKYQQTAYNGHYGNAFMFFGASFAFAVSLTMYLTNYKNRPSGIKKYTLLFPIAGGISSALLNLLIMRLLSSNLSESIIFPGIAVGGLTFTMLFSIIGYRERLTVLQWCGLSIGVIALVFLNIG